MTAASFFGMTDVGLKRPHNEDAFAVAAEEAFAVVADGMGGAAAGEVASAIFADTAREVLSAPKKSPAEAVRLVEKTFALSNERMHDRVKTNPEYSGMGCTAEVLVLLAGSYVIGHIGDSRTYVFRQGLLRQVTKDHSLVQQHIDRGIISAAEARTHSARNIILKAVGVDEAVDADLLQGETQPGDLFLLCSDGLTDMVEDREIERVLASKGSMADRVRQLIDLAKAGGGHDNITAVLCEAG